MTLPLSPRRLPLNLVAGVGVLPLPPDVGHEGPLILDGPRVIAPYPLRAKMASSHGSACHSAARAAPHLPAAAAAAHQLQRHLLPHLLQLLPQGAVEVLHDSLRRPLPQQALRLPPFLYMWGHAQWTAWSGMHA